MAKEVLEMEVKSNIKSVTKDTEKMAESVKDAKEETKELAKETEDVGKAAKKSSGGVKALAKGFGSLIKSLGIIGLLAAAFTALKEALERNQKVMDVVSTIMSTISTTFNQVVDVLTDTVKWVTESSDRFDGLTKVLKGIMTIALTPLKAAFFGLKLGVQEAQLAFEKWLGGADPQKMAELRIGIGKTQTALEEIALAAVESGKDIGKNIGDAIGEIGAIGKMAIEGITDISIKSNIELAKATTAAANSSKLAEAAIQGLIEKYDRQAELQRQIRDDETKTFDERIAANKELGDILNEQEEEMLALADTRVASAKLELSANTENIELQVAYQQALNDRAGVEAQVAGFRSEQMTNEVSLNKELIEIKKELGLAGLEGVDLELAELRTAYEMKLEMARKAGEDDIAVTEQYLKEKEEIITAADKVISDQAIANAKAEADAKAKIRDANISNIESGIGLVKSLAGENKDIQAAAIIAENAVGIAKTIIATQTANAGALATPQAIASSGVAAVPVIAANNIAAALSIATSVAATAQGLSALGAGGGGGGGGNLPAASPGAGAQTPAPQMMSGAFELTGGQEVEPTRAYVVSDDITASQNGLEVIRRRATI
tara:strand:- start:934 stop:2754 length:1821 start_codon:yes stop_codon:yes gene_type:complete